MSVAATKGLDLSCQIPQKKKSVRFTNDTKEASDSRSYVPRQLYSERIKQEVQLEKERQQRLTTLFRTALARLSSVSEEFTKKSLRDEMWRLLEGKVEGKTDSGRCEFTAAEIQALLIDIERDAYTPSNDPQILKAKIEEGLGDVDAIVNEDGTFNLYYSKEMPQYCIDNFLHERQKDVDKYLWKFDIRTRKELGSAAVDASLVFQKLYQLHQQEGGQGVLVKSEIRWFVEESEKAIKAGLEDLHGDVMMRNPRTSGDRLITKMFLANVTAHKPTIEELRSLYLEMYNAPYATTENPENELKELVDLLRPELVEVRFVISDRGRELTMYSQRYPQICLQHIKNFVDQDKGNPS